MKTITLLNHPTDGDGDYGYFLDKEVARMVCQALFPSLILQEQLACLEIIPVYEKAEDFFAKYPRADLAQYPGEINARAVVQARALAKLTIEECEALGLGAEQGFHKVVLEP